MEQPKITLSDASGVPYYRQIVDQLAQSIRSGQLPPDGQLPSVRELAAQLMVSLITVRRAYTDLETAGLIVCRQGQGTYVAKDVKHASPEQALEEARAALAGALEIARRLGLQGDELRHCLDELLAGQGE